MNAMTFNRPNQVRLKLACATGGFADKMPLYVTSDEDLQCHSLGIISSNLGPKNCVGKTYQCVQAVHSLITLSWG